MIWSPRFEYHVVVEVDDPSLLSWKDNVQTLSMKLVVAGI